MYNKYKFTSIPLNVGVLEAIWLEHTKAFSEVEKQYKVDVQYQGNRIILKGVDKQQCVKAQQFIENKVTYQFKMELLEFNSESETYPFKRMIQDEVYLELSQQYPGLWSFNRFSLTKILNKMNEKYNYIVQLPNLPTYFVLIWIPQSNYITLKQLILDLLQSYCQNQENQIRNNQNTVQQDRQKYEMQSQYINITALETILIFLLLDCPKIEGEFRVIFKLIQKTEQIILVISGDQTCNFQKPIQIVTKTLSSKNLHQYFHLNQSFNEQELMYYESSIQKRLQTQVYLYSFNQIVNKALELENTFKIQILNQFHSSKEDLCSTFCLGPKNKKIEINDIFTQLIRDMSYQQSSLVSNNSYVIKKEQLPSQADNNEQNSSKSELKLLNMEQQCDNEILQPKSQDKDKENKQSQFLKNDINVIVRSEQGSKITQSDSLSEGINSQSKKKSSSTSLEIPDNQFNPLVEQRMQQLLSTTEITENIFRQVIQFSQNSFQIIYESKSSTDNMLDLEFSLNNYIKELKIDGKISLTKQILQIDTIDLNTKYLDEFFRGSQYYLVCRNQQSQDFVENQQKIYKIESKLTNQSNIGVLTQLEYEQIQFEQQGQFIAFSIWNFLGFDDNIKKSITNLMSQRNEIIEPWVLNKQDLLLNKSKNKIIKILSQDQLTFLQLNSPSLQCKKISKYSDQLLTSFHYIQMKNDQETINKYQIQLTNIGKNLVSQFIFEEKKKLNQQKRIQISNNCWKLIFYSNIQEFYLKWLEDLYSQTLNLEDYQQIGHQGTQFTEVAINLGNFSIRSDQDLKQLDDFILNNMNYKCQKIQRLTELKAGNYLIAIMRDSVMSIDNVTQLDPANTLIRGYAELNTQLK